MAEAPRPKRPKISANEDGSSAASIPLYAAPTQVAPGAGLHTTPEEDRTTRLARRFSLLTNVACVSFSEFALDKLAHDSTGYNNYLKQVQEEVAEYMALYRPKADPVPVSETSNDRLNRGPGQVSAVGGRGPVSRTTRQSRRITRQDAARAAEAAAKRAAEDALYGPPDRLVPRRLPRGGKYRPPSPSTWYRPHQTINNGVVDDVDLAALDTINSRKSARGRKNHPPAPSAYQALEAIEPPGTINPRRLARGGKYRPPPPPSTYQTPETINSGAVEDVGYVALDGSACSPHSMTSGNPSHPQNASQAPKTANEKSAEKKVSPTPGSIIQGDQFPKYIPLKAFLRGPRPALPRKGIGYSDKELIQIKVEYERYQSENPDRLQRLHAEHLGAYISDVVYEKYGINRTGSAIKLCYQRWIRGRLTNMDDRVRPNPKNLRTSLQGAAATKSQAKPTRRRSAYDEEKDEDEDEEDENKYEDETDGEDREGSVQSENSERDDDEDGDYKN